MRSLGSRFEVGWIEDLLGIYSLIPHTHTHKSEIKNAVMKCGPEKGHWVVVRQSEREVIMRDHE